MQDRGSVWDDHPYKGDPRFLNSGWGEKGEWKVLFVGVLILKILQNLFADLVSQN